MQQGGSHDDAEQLAASLGIDEHGTRTSLVDIFRGRNVRSNLALGRGHVLNYFPVQVFSALGTTVLVSMRHVSFTNSLVILLLSNLVAYLGYLTHGWLGHPLRPAQRHRRRLDHRRDRLRCNDLRAQQLAGEDTRTSTN